MDKDYSKIIIELGRQLRLYEDDVVNKAYVFDQLEQKLNPEEYEYLFRSALNLFSQFCDTGYMNRKEVIDKTLKMLEFIIKELQ